MDDFLTEEECEALQALASGDLRRSRVTDGMVSSGRTSFSTFFTGAKSHTPLVIEIEERLKEVVSTAHAALLALEGEETDAKPLFVAAEPLQVVRYSTGQGYCAHFDNRSGSHARICTAMVYLNSPIEGGHTFFPRGVPLEEGEEADDEERAGGLRIEPVQGRALIFWNIRAGREDDRSLHEAMPVLRGNKWIATKWLTLAE